LEEDGCLFSGVALSGCLSGGSGFLAGTIGVCFLWIWASMTAHAGGL
jgi:hypothetical protein